MIRTTARILRSKYDSNEAMILARELLCHVTNTELSRLLMIDNDIKLDNRQQTVLNNLTEKLLEGEPLQYVIGKTFFCGHKFKCDSRALIPRPETEELVNLIISDHDQSSDISILDIGTGTGCIAVSLACALPESQVSAIDISHETLCLAAENAEHLNVKVQFIEDNILNCRSDYASYNVIVSNPPYIRLSEQTAMEHNVLDYEPHTALFVPDSDPLIFYRAIGIFGTTHLRRGGKLYLEINQYLGQETVDLLICLGYRNVNLYKDINNNDRIITATL